MPPTSEPDGTSGRCPPTFCTHIWGTPRAGRRATRAVDLRTAVGLASPSPTRQAFADGVSLPSELPLTGLRHTWATLALERDIHTRVVRERLGHSMIAITLGIYGQVAPTLHDEAGRARRRPWLAEAGAFSGIADPVAARSVRRRSPQLRRVLRAAGRGRLRSDTHGAQPEAPRRLARQ